MQRAEEGEVLGSVRGSPAGLYEEGACYREACVPG
jgi:hypothetical protein